MDRKDSWPAVSCACAGERAVRGGRKGQDERGKERQWEVSKQQESK